MCLGSRSTNYFQNNLKNALAKVSPMHKIKQIPYACENISSLNWIRSPHWGDPIALNYVSLNLASQTDIVWLRQKDISRHNSSKEIFVWIQTHVPAHTHTNPGHGPEHANICSSIEISSKSTIPRTRTTQSCKIRANT